MQHSANSSEGGVIARRDMLLHMCPHTALLLLYCCFTLRFRWRYHAARHVLLLYCEVSVVLSRSMACSTQAHRTAAAVLTSILLLLLLLFMPCCRDIPCPRSHSPHMCFHAARAQRGFLLCCKSRMLLLSASCRICCCNSRRCCCCCCCFALRRLFLFRDGTPSASLLLSHLARSHVPKLSNETSSVYVGIRVMFSTFSTRV
jgi:hypothetical protein